MLLYLFLCMNEMLLNSIKSSNLRNYKDVERGYLNKSQRCKSSSMKRKMSFANKTHWKYLMCEYCKEWKWKFWDVLQWRNSCSIYVCMLVTFHKKHYVNLPMKYICLSFGKFFIINSRCGIIFIEHSKCIWVAIGLKIKNFSYCKMCMKREGFFYLWKREENPTGIWYKYIFLCVIIKVEDDWRWKGYAIL